MGARLLPPAAAPGEDALVVDASPPVALPPAAPGASAPPAEASPAVPPSGAQASHWSWPTEQYEVPETVEHSHGHGQAGHGQGSQHLHSAGTATRGGSGAGHGSRPPACRTRRAVPAPSPPAPCPPETLTQSFISSPLKRTGKMQGWPVTEVRLGAAGVPAAGEGELVTTSLPTPGRWTRDLAPAQSLPSAGLQRAPG